MGTAAGGDVGAAMKTPATTVRGSPSALLVLAVLAAALALIVGVSGCGPLLPQQPPAPLVEVFTATANPDGTVTLAWLADYTTTVAINTGLAVQTLPGCRWTLAPAWQSAGAVSPSRPPRSPMATAEITTYAARRYRQRAKRRRRWCRDAGALAFGAGLRCAGEGEGSCSTAHTIRDLGQQTQPATATVASPEVELVCRCLPGPPTLRPSTGKHNGSCPGFDVSHFCPLFCGPPCKDEVAALSWLPHSSHVIFHQLLQNCHSAVSSP